MSKPVDYVCKVPEPLRSCYGDCWQCGHNLCIEMMRIKKIYSGKLTEKADGTRYLKIQ